MYCCIVQGIHTITITCGLSTGIIQMSKDKAKITYLVSFSELCASELNYFHD